MRIGNRESAVFELASCHCQPVKPAVFDVVLNTLLVDEPSRLDEHKVTILGHGKLEREE